jgi:hypothetical protein
MRITGSANTETKERGIDIVAQTPKGRALLVTVKGYPDPKYRSRHTQARHLFADALLDLIFYRDENPEAELALGLPDGFTTYLALAKRVQLIRRSLVFTIWWASEDGSVRIQEP